MFNARNMLRSRSISLSLSLSLSSRPPLGIPIGCGHQQ
ncbi:unnamed protein product [Spirodela intermedia]|uniref:Uncharacterized protein n=1 Tax=Spirodela intermedia TaxID=51605 RepID=A0A7I8J1K4_SPIIN|nr:unnamed protein product [Spirodela intermedia]CAA6664038.1 unnamed protein product [Spirodela intermedia]